MQAEPGPQRVPGLVWEGYVAVPEAKSGSLIAREALALQRIIGNAAVQRMLGQPSTVAAGPPSVAAAIQRQGEGGEPEVDLISGGSFSLLGEEGGLQLDDELMAEMRARQIVQQILNPDSLRPNLFQIPAEFGGGPDIMAGPTTPEPRPLVPAGRGPSRPRPAKTEDVLKAILAVPAIDGAITNLRTEALEGVSRDVRSLSAGETALVISAVAAVGGGAVAGIALDPETRAAVLSQLNGRVIPVPGVTGLGLEVNTAGDNVMAGFHLDVGALLGGRGGFGPSSPKAMGAPPVRRMVDDGGTSKPAPPAREHSRPQGPIQRENPGAAAAATGQWRAPFELGTARTYAAAHPIAARVWIDLYGVSQALENAEQEWAVTQLADLLEEAGSWMRYLASQVGEGKGTEPLTAREGGDLTDFGREAERAYKDKVRLLRRMALESLSPLSNAEEPDTSTTEDELAEALHFAFIEASESQIESLKEAIGLLKKYKDEVKKVLTWAKRASDAAGAAQTVAKLDKAIGGLNRVGGVVDRVSNVATAAKAFATISGMDNQAVGPAQNAINKFEEQLNAIDTAMSFFKGVPLVGALWSSYYAPMTRECLRLLRVIARHKDVECRTYGAVFARRSGRGAPVIPEGAESCFPGGQPVLNFMWGLMQDSEPAATPAVESFFLQHKKLFNVGQERWDQLKSEGGSSWYKPWTWGDEETLTNLMPWVRRNKTTVWQMLYGRIPATF